MPNYKEVTATGVSYTRSNAIWINNPKEGIPNITFSEERVVDLGNGEIIHRPVGNLTEKFSDPTKTFDMVNPADGTVVGVASYMELYVMLYSLYLKLATDRDAATGV